MAQQINLCTPILLTHKRYFSAHTMAIALGVFLVLGGALCGVWVWNLQLASEGFRQTLATQSQEIENLQSAIRSSKANAAPVDPALLAQLQERLNTISQREKLREALKEGQFRPGWGHSDRLLWIAHSIPAPVWITDARLDGSRFDVTGFTLEPAALNGWVEKLAVSPLMQGLKLSTVKVENATMAPVTMPASAGSAPSVPARAVWSFNLVSAEPFPAAALLASSGPSGGKP